MVNEQKILDWAQWYIAKAEWDRDWHELNIADVLLGLIDDDSIKDGIRVEYIRVKHYLQEWAGKLIETNDIPPYAKPTHGKGFRSKMRQWLKYQTR